MGIHLSWREKMLLLEALRLFKGICPNLGRSSRESKSVRDLISFPTSVFDKPEEVPNVIKHSGEVLCLYY